MHQLDISIIIEETEDDGARLCVQLSVDGVSLRDLVRRHELPMAAREGHPDLAGSYDWLDFDLVSRDYLLGKSDHGSCDDVKTALMGCSCGIVSCWPLMVRISQSSSQVIWSDFEQPFRHPKAAAGHWDYSEFGPFTFDRHQYLAQLDRLTGSHDQRDTDPRANKSW